MKPVADEFSRYLSDVTFSPPRVEFIDNVTGTMEKDPETIRKKLVLQISSPVQWERSMRTACDTGASLFIESGPGSVLVGLAKRIVKNQKIISGEKLIKDT
jgi:[acyl-carrier-protein] S-malonyltransferase